MFWAPTCHLLLVAAKSKMLATLFCREGGEVNALSQTRGSNELGGWWRGGWKEKAGRIPLFLNVTNSMAVP